MHAIESASEERFVDRLRAVAYGLVLVGLGILMLVPGDQNDVWLVWTGLVLAGASTAKVAAGYGVPWLTVIVAVSAFAWGAGDLAGVPISGIGVFATLGGIAVLVGAAHAAADPGEGASATPERTASPRS